MLQSLLESFESTTNSTALLYCASNGKKFLGRDDVIQFQRAIKTAIGSSNRLSLILTTDGGLVSAARTIAVQLKRQFETICVFIPERARSAGTIVCLSGTEVVLGEYAEVGPIDPLLRGSKGNTRGAAEVISSEDIRSFRELGTKWFGLTSESSRLDLLRILTTEIHPTTLTSFFRADSYVREVAAELLSSHPDPQVRQATAAIIERLISSAPDHFHPFYVEDLKEAGMPARACSVAEEAVVGRLHSAACAALAERQNARAIIATPRYAAIFVDENSDAGKNHSSWIETPI